MKELPDQIMGKNATVVLTVRIDPELRKEIRTLALARRRNGTERPDTRGVVVDALWAYVRARRSRRG